MIVTVEFEHDGATVEVEAEVERGFHGTRGCPPHGGRIDVTRIGRDAGGMGPETFLASLERSDRERLYDHLRSAAAESEPHASDARDEED